jgi:PilZ domain
MSLQPEKHVMVRLPGGDPLPASIEDVDDSSVTVALLLKAHLPLERFRDRNASVEYSTRKGLHRLACIVEREAPGDRLVLKREPSEDVLQRRDWFRVEAYVPLTIVTREESSRTLETTTHDLSGGGMLIADPLKLEAGTELEIAIKTGSGEPIRAVGRVVRNTFDGKTAVQILEMDRADRQELVRYITERERAALRVARGR